MTDDICDDAIETKCEDLECESFMRTPRQRLLDVTEIQPVVHIGAMGCANTVMKSGRHRDNLTQKKRIIAVEMEGAGVWRYSPSLVIKGVCDYADSHKRKNWQRYAAATAAACTKAFLLEWWAPERQETSFDQGSVIPLFDIPKTQKVKKLMGREDELAKIASYFDGTGNKEDPPRIVVLQAMGGQGKSQIALEYCHRARKTHQAIFWVNCSSDAAISQALIGVALQLDKLATEMLSDDNAKVKLAVQLLERWEHRWLLVFDNYDDPSTFAEVQDKFLPQVGNGDILFTSRHRCLEGLGTMIEVPEMPQKAGVELLMHRYRGVNFDEYLTEGAEIVNRLGNLALAIDQASAYFHYTRLTVDKIDTFLPKYFAQREKVLKHTEQQFWKYTKHGTSNEHERDIAMNAFTTWEMSFQQLLNSVSDSDDVAHFVTLAAFFGQAPIMEIFFSLYWVYSETAPSWMTIFLDPVSTAANGDDGEGQHGGYDAPHPVIESFQKPKDPQGEAPQELWSSNRFWDIIYQAHQMSVLDSKSPATEAGDISFSFHPLIRDWLQLRLPVEERQIYTREAIDILALYIRAQTLQSTDAQMRLRILLHVDSLIACDNDLFLDGHRLGQDISTCDATSWLVSFYHNQGLYNMSHSLLYRQMVTRTGILGMDHVLTLESMHRYAVTLSSQGRYIEAEQMCRQVVESHKHLLGNEHPSTLTSMSSLATVLCHQGRYIEAEQMFSQVLEKRERILGIGHPDTLSSTNNLAGVLGNQGKYRKAEQLHRQVSVEMQRVLGTENPSTLTIMSNLAEVLREQGEYREAEQLHRQVLVEMQRVLGTEHPSTLSSMNNLAGVLIHQERYDEAEVFQKQSVQAGLVVLGPQHPDTKASLVRLVHIWDF